MADDSALTEAPSIEELVAALDPELQEICSPSAGTPDANWPEPEEDGWTWRKIERTCECSHVNEFHAQHPASEAVNSDEGLVWECRNCGHKHRIGGKDPELPPAGYILECGECHNTYDPNTVEVGTDGSWTCPTDRKGCGTPNRYVNAAEASAASQAGTVTTP